MSSGTENPIFTNGFCIIEGFEGRKFRLAQKTWESHILKDRCRWYLRNQFNKVIETLKQPDYILQSPSEKCVGFYAKKFNDLYIWNTATVAAYLYIGVNLNNNLIRTVYDNPKLKGWEKIWPKS